MRKSLWIVPLVLLFAAIAPPKAHADDEEYTSTFTCNEGASGIYGAATACTVALPTALDVTFNNPNSDTPVTMTWDGETGVIDLSAADAPGDEYVWDAVGQPAGSGYTYLYIVDLANLDAPAVSVDGDPAGDLQDYGVLTFATPEPSTLSLLPLGLGLLFVMRKRIAQGLHQAT